MTVPLTGLRPLIALSKVRREFPSGEGTIIVLKDVDLTIHAGEMVAIVGPSGSGKSTLMNILGCLDRPSGGSYRVSGRETRSEEHTSELQSLMRISYAVFCLQKKNIIIILTSQRE